MEYLLPSEIARLVYGYLDSEKCEEAASVFLRTSEHLRECYQASLRNRKFSTQVMGFTLMKCIDQFCAIHRLVQDRIAALQEDNISCHELVDQVAYLLDVGCKGHSTVMFNITVPAQDNVNKTIDETIVRYNQTPAYSVPPSDSSNVVSYSVSVEGSPAKPTWCIANSTPSQSNRPQSGSSPSTNEEKLNIPETTSLDSLPGTVKSQRKTSKYRRKEPVPVEKVIKKALQDEKLHERIADNINKVIFTPEKFKPEKEKESSGGDELESVIQTIVDQTQEDPYFENFLDEFFEGVAKNDTSQNESSDGELKCKKKVSEVDKKLTKDSSRKSKSKRSKSETTKTTDSTVGDTSKKCAIVKPNNPRSDCLPFECLNDCSINKVQSTSTSLIPSPSAIYGEPSQSTKLNPLTTAASKAQYQEINSSQQTIPNGEVQSHTMFSSGGSIINHQTYPVFDKKLSMIPVKATMPNFNHSLPPSLTVPSQLSSTALKQSVSSIVVLPSASVLPTSQIANKTVASMAQIVTTFPNQIAPLSSRTGSARSPVTLVHGDNQFSLPLPKSVTRVFIAEENLNKPKYGIYTKDSNPGMLLSTVTSSSDFVNIAPKGAFQETDDEEDSEKITTRITKAKSRKKSKSTSQPNFEASNDSKKKRPTRRNGRSSPTVKIKTEDAAISLDETSKEQAGPNVPSKKMKSAVSSFLSSGSTFCPSKIEFPDELIKSEDARDDYQNSSVVADSIISNETAVPQNMPVSDSESRVNPAVIGSTADNPEKMVVDPVESKIPVCNESGILSSNVSICKEDNKSLTSEVISVPRKTDAKQRQHSPRKTLSETNVIISEQNKVSPNSSINLNCVATHQVTLSSTAENLSPRPKTQNSFEHVSHQSGELEGDEHSASASVRQSVKRNYRSFKDGPKLPTIPEPLNNESEETSELEPVKKKLKSQLPRNPSNSSTSCLKECPSIRTKMSYSTENLSTGALSTLANPQTEGEGNLSEHASKHADMTFINSVSSGTSRTDLKEGPENFNIVKDFNVNRSNLSSNKILSLRKLVSPVNQSRIKKLSSSTPRNKRNHVRALDFSTPPNLKSASQRTAVTSPKAASRGLSCVTERFRNVCRSHLFESPVVKYAVSPSKPQDESTREGNRMETDSAVISSKPTSSESAGDFSRPMVNETKENLNLSETHSETFSSKGNSLPCDGTPMSNRLINAGLLCVSPEENLEGNVVALKLETHLSQASTSRISPSDVSKTFRSPKRKGNSRIRYPNDQSVKSYSITKSNYIKVVKKVTRKTIRSKKFSPLQRQKCTKSKRRTEAPRLMKKSLVPKRSHDMSQHHWRRKSFKIEDKSISPEVSIFSEELNSDSSDGSELNLQPQSGSPQTSSSSVVEESADSTPGCMCENNFTSSSHNEMKVTDGGFKVHCFSQEQSSSNYVQMNDGRGIIENMDTSASVCGLRSGQTEEVCQPSRIDSSKFSLFTVKSSPNDNLIDKDVQKDNTIETSLSNQKMSILESALRQAPSSSSLQENMEVNCATKFANASTSVKSETETESVFHVPGDSNPRGIINTTFFENDETSVKFKINRNLELARRDCLLRRSSNTLTTKKSKPPSADGALMEKKTDVSSTSALAKAGKEGNFCLRDIIQSKKSFGPEKEGKSHNLHLSKDNDLGAGNKRIRSADQLKMNVKPESEVEFQNSEIAKSTTENNRLPISDRNLVNAASQLDDRACPSDAHYSKKQTNYQVNVATLNSQKNDAVCDYREPNEMPTGFDESCSSENLLIVTMEEDHRNLNESSTVEREQRSLKSESSSTAQDSIQTQIKDDASKKPKAVTNRSSDRNKSVPFCQEKLWQTINDVAAFGSREKEELLGLNRLNEREAKNLNCPLNTHTSEEGANRLFVHFEYNGNKRPSKLSTDNFLRNTAFLEDYSCIHVIEEENSNVGGFRLAVTQEDILLNIPSKLKINAKVRKHVKDAKNKTNSLKNSDQIQSSHSEEVTRGHLEPSFTSEDLYSGLSSNQVVLAVNDDQSTEAPECLANLWSKNRKKSDTENTRDTDCSRVKKVSVMSETNPSMLVDNKSVFNVDKKKPGLSLSRQSSEITQMRKLSDCREVDKNPPPHGSERPDRKVDVPSKVSETECDRYQHVSSDVCCPENAQVLELSETHSSPDCEGEYESAYVESRHCRTPKIPSRSHELDRNSLSSDCKLRAQLNENSRKEIGSGYMEVENPHRMVESIVGPKINKTSGEIFETRSERESTSTSNRVGDSKNTLDIETVSFEIGSKGGKEDKSPSSSASSDQDRTSKIYRIESGSKDELDRVFLPGPSFSNNLVCQHSPVTRKFTSFPEERKSPLQSPSGSLKSECRSSNKIKSPTFYRSKNTSRNSIDENHRYEDLISVHVRERMEEKKASRISVIPLKSPEKKHKESTLSQNSPKSKNFVTVSEGKKTCVSPSNEPRGHKSSSVTENKPSHDSPPKKVRDHSRKKAVVGSTSSSSLLKKSVDQHRQTLEVSNEQREKLQTHTPAGTSKSETDAAELTFNDIDLSSIDRSVLEEFLRLKAAIL